MVQARGYGLIGESQRAEKELAAAVDAAPDDPEIGKAHAEVSEELTRGARAEAERKEGAELGAGKNVGGAKPPKN